MYISRSSSAGRTFASALIVLLWTKETKFVFFYDSDGMLGTVDRDYDVFLNLHRQK
jgi:hypothetical protein